MRVYNAMPNNTSFSGAASEMERQMSLTKYLHQASTVRDNDRAYAEAPSEVRNDLMQQMEAFEDNDLRQLRDESSTNSLFKSMPTPASA